VKFRVKLEKTKIERCTLLVDADTKEAAEQQAISNARYVEWRLEDVSTKALSAEEDHG